MNTSEDAERAPIEQLADRGSEGLGEESQS
jgi:hypothetical protein